MAYFRTIDEKFVFFDTPEQCAEAAAPVFSANRWRWSERGIPDHAAILDTLKYLAREAEDEYRESGRLVYYHGRYGYQRPKPAPGSHEG